MATPTRSDTTSPEVDVISEIRINRLRPRITQTFQPSCKVMESDGVTQSTNALGQPDHKPAALVGPYQFVIDSNTPDGTERIIALEAGALSRLVYVILLAATGNAPTPEDVEALTTQLLQSGYGIDWAMVQEGEALRDAMLEWWDLQDPKPIAANTALLEQFAVYVEQDEITGPFRDNT